MSKSDVKNIITFVISAKSVHKQVVTNTMECMYSVIEDACCLEYGESWFESLKKLAENSLKSAEKIYSCDLKMLFSAFLESEELVDKLFKNNIEQKQEFLTCVKVALVDLENLTDEKVPDINDQKWEDGITHLKEIVNFFPLARDRLGESFISKVAVHCAQLKKIDRYMPTYGIQKTIQDEALQITVGEFVEHCISQETVVVTQDKALCFCTKSYDEFLKGVKAYIEILTKAKEQKQKRILLMKIAVVVMAIILLFLSAYISSSITRSVSKNDKSQTPSEMVSSVDDGDFEVSSSNDESSELSTSSTDLVSSETSSVTDNTITSEPSTVPPDVVTTVDENGRVTVVSNAKYRYKDGGSFNGDYIEYSTAVKDAIGVYMEPYKYYLTGNQPDVTFYIENNTDNMIRNISYELIVYDENGNKIFSHTETKVMKNGATVSIANESNHYYNIELSAGDLHSKDADLGFTKVYSKVSYDIVEQ